MPVNASYHLNGMTTILIFASPPLPIFFFRDQLALKT